MLDDKDLKEIDRIVKRRSSGIEWSISCLMFVIWLSLFLNGCHKCHALPIREALSQVESGSNDKVRGRAGEVSRYQILPSVWKEYSSLPNYRDETHAWVVAERILADRRETFRLAMNRQPTPKELYALYNAPGLFRRVRYDWRRLPYRVRERAVRFENLVRSK